MRQPTNIRARTRKSGGRGTVTTSRKVSGEEDVEESHEVEAELNTVNPAYVGVTQGLTKNVGDYNSVKIGVSVSLPCNPNEDEKRLAYQPSTNFANTIIDED